jgi:hypothetical protein
MKKKEQFNLALWDRLKQNNIPHEFETRRGKIITQVTLFNRATDQMVCGFDTEDNSIEDWSINGDFRATDAASSLDLFITWDEEQLMLEGWLNVYGNGNANYHPTKEGAENDASTGRIACVKVSIPYTKGEGLSEPTTN